MDSIVRFRRYVYETCLPPADQAHRDLISGASAAIDNAPGDRAAFIVKTIRIHHYRFVVSVILVSFVMVDKSCACIGFDVTEMIQVPALGKE